MTPKGLFLTIKNSSREAAKAPGKAKNKKLKASFRAETQRKAKKNHEEKYLFIAFPSRLRAFARNSKAFVFLCASAPLREQASDL